MMILSTLGGITKGKVHVFQYPIGCKRDLSEKNTSQRLVAIHYINTMKVYENKIIKICSLFYTTISPVNYTLF